MATNATQARAIPAAQYLRMSTEHQRYSIGNQRAAIAKFAVANGMEIVQTFEDQGKSGLTLTGRPGLQDLLREALSPLRLFETVVVYDVSRWGRFQDVDESAFYEHLCRRVGIRVLYCSEHFDALPGPMGVVIKSVKRAMAAEYSRELSAKIHATMVVLARLGHHAGGPPAFALKRVQVSKEGFLLRELHHGERKSNLNDHVELAPGDPFDCGLVRLIFFLFVHCKLCPRAIAAQLNWNCYPSRIGLAPWTSLAIRDVLRNENYAGTLVYGAQTQRMRTTPRYVPKLERIRVPEAFKGIVSIRDFDAAQELVGEPVPRRKWTNTELLGFIRKAHATFGSFDSSMVQAIGGPPTQMYVMRFGSMAEACKAAGVEATQRLKTCSRRRTQRHAIKQQIIEWLAEYFRGSGRTFYCHSHTRRACIGTSLTVSVRAVAPLEAHGTIGWAIHPDRKVRPDVCVVARVTDGGEILDYFVIPGDEQRRGFIGKHGQTTCDWLSVCRCKTRSEVIARLETSKALKPTVVPRWLVYEEGRRQRCAELPPHPLRGTSFNETASRLIQKALTRGEPRNRRLQRADTLRRIQ